MGNQSPAINIGIDAADRATISEAAADKAGDEPTLDLLTQRLDYHEKTAWMLRSMLEE